MFRLKKKQWAEPEGFLQKKYPQYEIGRYSYGDPEVHSHPEARLTVGAFCSIASGVQILLGGEHRPDWVTTFPFNVLWEAGQEFDGQPLSKGDVVIGNDVWIGMDAIIMSGVTIGDGAVIGLRSVVTHDVPAYAIVVGSPARIVKYRFDKGIVKKLQAIRWWEWDDQRIEKALPLMLNSDISNFVLKVEQGLL